jgi:DNA-binding LacI/PurR family transcriptional regulator
MHKKPTIQDIARRAGVSDTAVSLAFRENSRVSAVTRARILSVAKDLDYVPNRTARALRSGDSRSIGFIVTDITDPFYSRMIRSAETIALRYGYGIIIAESNWDADREVRAVTDMIESRVQGLLMCFCERTRRGLELIERSGLPVIAVDTYPPSYRGPYVANDVKRAGRMAAEHLVAVGSRSPVFFHASESMCRFSAFSLLQKGFAEYLHERKVRFGASSIVHADITIEGGTKGFARLLETGHPFDGIFCVNDLCAIGAMEAAEKNGFRVGRDLAVMGIDNLELSGVSRISLTSIHQPYDKIIETATRVMVESLADKRPCAVRKRLNPTLVVRGSSAAFALRRQKGPAAY